MFIFNNITMKTCIETEILGVKYNYTHKKSVIKPRENVYLIQYYIIELNNFNESCLIQLYIFVKSVLKSDLGRLIIDI